jgi:hypothetical protein
MGAPENGEPPADLDSVRSEAVAELGRHASAGLTLGEYAERIEAVRGASSADEVAAAMAGVAELEASPTRPASRWLVGVLGGTRHGGRWRLGRRLRIVAVLGGVKLDLGQAQPEAPDPRVTILTVLGGVELTAPPGVPIEFSGLSLLGGRSDERPPGTPLPGSAVVGLRAFCLLGGVKVKAPPAT